MLIQILKVVCVGVMSVMICSTGALGQIITFNSPAPWVTLRNDNIVVKAQIDTSKFAQKKIVMALSKVENNRKKILTTRTFKVTDFTQDFNLGSAGANLLGGKDFLRIDWSVPGATDKGFCAPIGISNIDKLTKIQTIHASKIRGMIEDQNIGEMVKNRKYEKIQNQDFAVFWSAKTLAIILKRAVSNNIIKFVFDGKNGKNSYISYPDKMIDYIAAKDSLLTYINERTFTDSIAYARKPWNTEITKISDKDFVMIKIPWYDLGMGNPFDGRAMGFSVFAVSEKATVVAAIPEKATVLVPGSWGTLVLDK